jgi:hypothetical protein
VHGSAIEKITQEGDGQALYSTQLLTDGEEIKESLRGVLLAAVAAVDNRDRAVFLSNMNAALLRVTENNSITIASQSTEGILESLTLLDRGVRGGDGDGASTKTLHSSIERSRRASRGLVEERGQDAASKDVQDTFALDTKTHLLSNGEEQMEISSAVRLNGQDVCVLERRRLSQELLQRRADQRLELEARGELLNRSSTTSRRRQSSANSTSIDTTETVQRLEATQHGHAAGLGRVGGLSDRGGGLDWRRHGRSDMRRHVLTLRRDRQDFTIKADGGVLESDSLNRSTHSAAHKRRPKGTRSHGVGTVNLSLDGGTRLIVELEDLHRVGVKAVLDVVNSQTTLSN